MGKVHAASSNSLQEVLNAKADGAHHAMKRHRRTEWVD